MSFLLTLLRHMWHARRPSRVADMPAMTCRHCLRPGYQALTFFGVVITRSEEVAAMMREDTDIRRHEMIHLRQAQSTGDSWLVFYALYIWYYLKALPMNRHMPRAAYLLNPFEMEAYAHMHDPHYADREATEWRTYAKAKPRQRLSSPPRTKNSKLRTQNSKTLNSAL